MGQPDGSYLEHALLSEIQPWKFLLRLLPTEIKYGNSEIKFGDKPLAVTSTRIPFDIKVESTQPFNVLDAGYEYSHAGFRLYFKRTKIGGLLSGFFGPTGLFALLSMISFGINPDVVREISSILYFKYKGDFVMPFEEWTIFHTLGSYRISNFINLWSILIIASKL